MRAKQISDVIAYHGEGPSWWPSLGALRIVDMLAGAVVDLFVDGTRRVASGACVRRTVAPPVVSSVTPRTGGGAIVAGRRSVLIADGDDLSGLRPLCELPIGDGVRTNEAASSPEGVLYLGTMAYNHGEGEGQLFALEPGSRVAPKLVLPRVTISNGMGWSPDTTQVYYNDTPTGTVQAFDWDPLEGIDPRSGRVFASVDGHPDGLAVDAEGGVWVALNGAGRVARYDPAGALTATVSVSAPQVTSCAFGGPELDTLYITTSREGTVGDAGDGAGAVFACDVGVRGLERHGFGRA